jgi:DNA segregation ATPase FtsK/SpoIIIE-like protein
VEVELHPFFTSFAPPASVAHSVNPCTHLKSQSAHPSRSLSPYSLSNSHSQTRQASLTSTAPVVQTLSDPPTAVSNVYNLQVSVQSSTALHFPPYVQIAYIFPTENYIQISSLPCMPHVPPISSSTLPLQQFVASSANQASARNDICSTVLPLPYFLSFRRPYLTSPVSVLPFKQHSHYTRRHKFNPTILHSMLSSKLVQHCRTDGRTDGQTDDSPHGSNMSLHNYLHGTASVLKS